MKCFYIFKKDKSESKKTESRPARELRNQSESDDSALSRRTRLLPSPRSIPELYEEKKHTLRVFSLQELTDATHGFNRNFFIGEGGFGRVYRGTIRPLDGRGDPIVVAIKKLDTHGLQGHKEWLAEIQFLGVVSHPNLVKLLGYCCVDGKDSERGIQRLLVYEFMPKLSLDNHLFRGTSTLPWKTRLEIMLGAAEGLVYLHEGLEVKVIHRDFKSQNLLLDENFKPKLSDFGLAREGPTGDRTHVTTAVRGTYGYAAPEYLETGHLRIESDIWAFGLVLYEILTGRRVVDMNRPTSEQKLVDWVRRFPPGSEEVSKLIDPRLGNNYSLSAAQEISELANSCLSQNPKDRPTMNQVIKILKQAIQKSEDGSSSVNMSAVIS